MYIYVHVHVCVFVMMLTMFEVPMGAVAGCTSRQPFLLNSLALATVAAAVSAAPIAPCDKMAPKVPMDVLHKLAAQASIYKYNQESTCLCTCICGVAQAGFGVWLRFFIGLL